MDDASSAFVTSEFLSWTSCSCAAQRPFTDLPMDISLKSGKFSTFQFSTFQERFSWFGKLLSKWMTVLLYIAGFPKLLRQPIPIIVKYLLEVPTEILN